MLRTRIGIATLLVAAAASTSSAAVLLDQIGPDATGVNGQAANASQRFEAANAGFHVVSGDDFVVPAGGSQTLSSIDVVLTGFNGFVAASFTNGTVQNYEVQVYSTSANAAANLTGNVASYITTGLTGVTTTAPFGTGPVTALVSINLSTAGINLAPGTYSIGVMPRLNFTGGGQIGVSLSTFGGGGGDGFQANPGGGFALPGNLGVNLGNFAYRINSVPASGTLALLGLGGLIAGRHRR